MTDLASEIRFTREARHDSHGTHYVPVLEIDGVVFPYYLRDTPRAELDTESGLYTVHLTLLADRVVVDLTLSDAANRAVDESLARFPEGDLLPTRKATK